MATRTLVVDVVTSPGWLALEAATFGAEERDCWRHCHANAIRLERDATCPREERTRAGPCGRAYPVRLSNRHL
jgi:hypothetical protein